MEDQVILVDCNDKPIGVAGKLAAHQSGRLHRALSVFLFDSAGRLLLQQRAESKYHSGGLWSNTCCSHSRPGEDTASAAHRRLQEEMGIDCALSEVFSFIYRTRFPNGLIEYEYDHVFFGRYDGTHLLNPDEADDSRWVKMDDLANDIKARPEAYSFWLNACFNRVRVCSRLFARERTCPETRLASCSS
ncbi:isopentenyl-diphosphate Delta-isomerase [Herbaspirillum sp. HC18]|nr:isopentenyl-diphosphate Delta-isomerase [Herbaspirillum sp. HC18]